jgi:hypothetical protein
MPDITGPTSHNYIPAADPLAGVATSPLIVSDNQPIDQIEAIITAAQKNINRTSQLPTLSAPGSAANTSAVSGNYTYPVQDMPDLMNNFQKLTNEQIGMVDIAMNKLGDTPEAALTKRRWVDLRAAVQDALSKFQQVIADMQSSQGVGARDRSHAQLEMSLAKLDERVKSLKDMRAKQAEQEGAAKKTNNPFMKFLSGVAAVFTIIVAAIVSPILVALAPITGGTSLLVTAMLCSSVVDQCRALQGLPASAMPELINWVDQAILTPMNCSDEASKARLNISLMALSILFCPGVFVVAPNAFTDFLDQSKAVYNLRYEDVHNDLEKKVKAGEMTEEEAVSQAQNEATKYSMGVTIALTTIAMVVGIAATVLCPANAGGMAANFSQKVESFISKTAEIIMKTLKISGEALQKNLSTLLKLLLNPQVWLHVSEITLQGVSAHYTVLSENLLAQLARMRAKLEADTEKFDATIDTLKQASRSC